MRWAGLCMGLGLLVSASAWAGEPIVVTLKWKPPNTMELSKLEPGAVVDHYNVYLCDAPILAGGENADDPQIEAPVCVSTLKMITSTEPKISGQYEVPSMTGVIHARISAVTKSGRESRLSVEAKYPFNFERTGPPQDPEFVEPESAAPAVMQFRR